MTAVSGQTTEDGSFGSGRRLEVLPENVDRLLFDVSEIDISERCRSRKELEQWNPHRGVMALLDSLIWETPDHAQGLAVKHVREDEFWVSGHFPGKPMMPGVLQLEAGAQLACYMYIVRKEDPALAAFLRIENAAFRTMVKPGDDLYLLGKEVKSGSRKFVSDIQGLVNGQIAFDARITGMVM